jgi:hypothetical protein
MLDTAKIKYYGYAREPRKGLGQSQKVLSNGFSR